MSPVRSFFYDLPTKFPNEKGKILIITLIAFGAIGIGVGIVALMACSQCLPFEAYALESIGTPGASLLFIGGVFSFFSGAGLAVRSVTVSKKLKTSVPESDLEEEMPIFYTYWKKICPKEHYVLAQEKKSIYLITSDKIEKIKAALLNEKRSQLVGKREIAQEDFKTVFHFCLLERLNVKEAYCDGTVCHWMGDTGQASAQKIPKEYAFVDIEMLYERPAKLLDQAEIPHQQIFIKENEFAIFRYKDQYVYLQSKQSELSNDLSLKNQLLAQGFNCLTPFEINYRQHLAFLHDAKLREKLKINQTVYSTLSKTHYYHDGEVKGIFDIEQATQPELKNYESVREEDLVAL